MLKLMLLLLNDLAAVCFYVINYLFKTTLIVQHSLFRCKKKKKKHFNETPPAVTYLNSARSDGDF